MHRNDPRKLHKSISIFKPVLERAKTAGTARSTPILYKKQEEK